MSTSGRLHSHSQQPEEQENLAATGRETEGRSVRKRATAAPRVAGVPWRILLIDPSQMTRECLAFTLEARVKDFLIESVARRNEASMEIPDLVLLDIKTGGGSEEILFAEIDALRRRFDGSPIIVLSEVVNASVAFAAIKNGLGGYLPTSLSFDVLVAALRLVLAGGVFIPVELINARPIVLSSNIESAAPTQRELRPEPANDRSFTLRELEVLRSLRQGKPNKIIAHELEIAASTVKVHIRNIMKKLNATNRTQVVLRTTETASPTPL